LRFLLRADLAVAGGQAHGFRRIGDISVIDDGPNRGRRVIYLKGPDGVVVEFVGERPA
jgi:hypothetical protein